MRIKRPQVSDDDNFMSKIIKYIPAEIIAVYTAIVGVLKQNLDSTLPQEKDVKTYFIVLLLIIILTPIWTYFTVIDNPNANEPPSKIKRAIFHSVIAAISFMIWVYAIGDVLFKSWLCGCYFPNTIECFDLSGKYNSVLGSIVLILYTGLLVPLLERIFLGRPQPINSINSRSSDIIAECKTQIQVPANKKDCNKFAKAVSSKFGVTLNGVADDIVDQIQGSDWTVLTNGIAAKEKADLGWLVIGGLKSADTVPTPPVTSVTHGHVVIVVSGPLDSTHGKYPRAFWGSLDGPISLPPDEDTINYAWNKNSRDKVIYSARQI